LISGMVAIRYARRPTSCAKAARGALSLRMYLFLHGLCLLVGCALLGVPARAVAQPCPLCGEWRLEAYDPGYDLHSLPAEARAQVQLSIQQLRQEARFVFRADSSYLFDLPGGKPEQGTWQASPAYILTEHGASRPDTLWIELQRADTLRLRLHDLVADADYRFTLVPAFQLTGLGAFVPGRWQLSRVEYDPQEIQDARRRVALARQIDSLRTQSEFVFDKDGSFRIRLLGSTTQGQYRVAGTRLTALEEGGGRTVFTLAAASSSALLLISYDPTRSPQTLQLVLTPWQAPSTLLRQE